MEDFKVLAPDKTRPRTFLYHKTKKPMIVYIGDENKFYAEGWENTPAAFFDMKAHGVPKEKMPELHKEIEDIKNLVNDEFNLDAMDAPQLKAYADKHMPGLKYHKTAKSDFMLKLIKDAKAEVEAEEEKFLSDDEFILEATEDDDSATHDQTGILESGDKTGGNTFI
jgi:hypothetical protein